MKFRDKDSACFHGAMPRVERDAYVAFLKQLGRGDLPSASARDLILDAASRLGLADTDPFAVASGAVKPRIAAVIASALDAPPPCAPMMMPTQALGYRPPSLVRSISARRRAGTGAAAK